MTDYTQDIEALKGAVRHWRKVHGVDNIESARKRVKDLARPYVLEQIFAELSASQQREPQEAAEREAQLQEAREQGWRAAIDVHSRHGMAGWSSHKDVALSAPQEASKD